ncbi:MAG: quinolinate synthase NadA [Leptospiraceae bacterium]|nr:quinolinate synthase NadA [Leptospiraceae bacterium]
MARWSATLDKRIQTVKQAYANTKTAEELAETETLIEEIEALKKEKNAVILGHNYMTPDVFWGVSDFTGDSLELSRLAMESEADIILFNGVYFMAETAKILNPARKILIADPKAGCSLSESITPEDIRLLRERHPGAEVVSYINCSADIKAAVDVICTSANAVKVVNSLKGDTVIMVPDGYLARNVQKQTDKKIIIWEGKCMVHELYTPLDIDAARVQWPSAKVIAHPECHPNVTEKTDFTGSTSQMGKYIQDSKAEQVLLLTECSMGDNLRTEFPTVEFVSGCQTCPHMKKITLAKVRDSLKNETFEVHLSPEVIEKGRHSLERMLAIGR